MGGAVTSIKAEDRALQALEEGESIFTFHKNKYDCFKGNVIGIIAGVTIIIIIWYVVAEIVAATKGVYFPRPWETFQVFAEAINGTPIQGKSIADHTVASLYRWGTAYILAVAVGISLGCLLGVSQRAHQLSIVSIYILQMVPGLAWVPMAMLIFGLGETATIFMIFMTAFPPIVINTSGGIRAVPQVHKRVAQMSGAGQFRTFVRVLLPASSLSIINGLRIGLANGWRVLIAAEMVVGVALGLGYVIIQSRYDLDYVSAFVSILVICLIGLIVEKTLFTVLEDKIMDRLGLDRG
ncbi:MAG: ABC transporter permease [Methanomassiliicoccales archaeon]|nr:MAG: ABC transporter permease [Methanomassiliicoccales archaeon]